METENKNGTFRQKQVFYSQVSNQPIKDTTLSLRAKGLYSLIQSFLTIPDFTLYRRYLLSICIEKETAFKTSWDELKDAGYLIQYKLKGPKGTFIYEYELVDSLPEREVPTEQEPPTKPINGTFRPKNISFSIITNEVLRHEKLSLKAKGLYVLIYSYITIPKFVLYKSYLVKQSKESDTAFKAAWKELKEAGFLHQHKIRGSNGKFIYEYSLSETPVFNKTTEKAKDKDTKKSKNKSTPKAIPVTENELKEPSTVVPTLEPTVEENSHITSPLELLASEIEATDNTPCTSPVQAVPSSERIAAANLYFQEICANIDFEQMKSTYTLYVSELTEVEYAIRSMLYLDYMVVDSVPYDHNFIADLLTQIKPQNVEKVVIRFRKAKTNMTIDHPRKYLQTMIFNECFNMTN